MSPKQSLWKQVIDKFRRWKGSQFVVNFDPQSEMVGLYSGCNKGSNGCLRNVDVNVPKMDLK